MAGWSVVRRVRRRGSACVPAGRVAMMAARFADRPGMKTCEEGMTRRVRSPRRRRVADHDRRYVRCASRCATPEAPAMRPARSTWRPSTTWSRGRRCGCSPGPGPAPDSRAGPGCRSTVRGLPSGARTVGRRVRPTCDMIWVLDAGLPTRAATSRSSTSVGTYIGTPDLLDEEAGVVGEYDGVSASPGCPAFPRRTSGGGLPQRRAGVLHHAGRGLGRPTRAWRAG